tara:strand:- start:382 stop:777 length:396 start_codon:yes stop_codon:yes gene_type:complete
LVLQTTRIERGPVTKPTVHVFSELTVIIRGDAGKLFLQTTYLGLNPAIVKLWLAGKLFLQTTYLGLQVTRVKLRHAAKLFLQTTYLGLQVTRVKLRHLAAGIRNHWTTGHNWSSIWILSIAKVSSGAAILA